MANEQNLIPFSERTENEQREIRRKGGKASGKARLRKKHGKELVRSLLEMKEVDPRIIEELQKLGLDAKEITNEVAMHIRQIEKAKRKADTNAYKAVNQAAGYTDDDERGGATVQIVISKEASAAAEKWCK